jgi:copper(I)-binding protein
MIRLLRALSLLAFYVGASSAAAEPPLLSDAWIRATPPGASTGAAYLTITSRGVGDRLLGATTPAARAVEIHRSAVEAGVHRMVRLEELTLPAGEPVRLEAGGLHLMLIDIARPLMPGTTVGFTLRFATAGNVEIEIPVVDARAGGATHAH